MKKYLLSALVVFVFSTLAVSAGAKKKKVVAVSPKKVTLVSSNDSLSYAAGMAYTQGLRQYLQQQFDMDSILVEDFVKGYESSISGPADPHAVAYNAGAQIAGMVMKKMLPDAVDMFKGSADSINVANFHNGFLAGVANDTTVFSLDNAVKTFTERAKADEEAKTEAYKKRNSEWLANNASVEGVQTTKSGLQYKVIRKGTGAVPSQNDEVVVKYEGRDIDGNVFDSSYKRNPQTVSFPLTSVIKGWSEALSLMPVGSKWEIYVPQELAYGSRQAGRIAPYSTLVFVVELVDVKKKDNKEEITAPAAEKSAAKSKNLKLKR